MKPGMEGKVDSALKEIIAYTHKSTTLGSAVM
jgi:hypothetical protein